MGVYLRDPGEKFIDSSHIQDRNEVHKLEQAQSETVLIISNLFAL